MHLVENEEQPACVAELAQVPKLLGCELAHAALALHRFEQDAGGLIADRRLDRSEIAERHLVEAVDLRAKSFEIFRLAAGGDRRERTAMEGALEGNHAVAVARATRIMIAPGHFEGAFQRLDPGIGEEHRIGEGRLGQPRRQPLAFGNAIEVGGVPQPRRLLVQRLDEMRMGMTERIHRNARAEIEILAPIFGGQSRPFAGDERHRMPVVDCKERWTHGARDPRCQKRKAAGGAAAVSPLCIGRATFRVNFVEAGPAAMNFSGGTMRMSQIAAWTADSRDTLTFQQLFG